MGKVACHFQADVFVYPARHLGFQRVLSAFQAGAAQNKIHHAEVMPDPWHDDDRLVVAESGHGRRGKGDLSPQGGGLVQDILLPASPDRRSHRVPGMIFWRLFSKKRRRSSGFISAKVPR